jgi:hypothetical protein
MTNWSALGRGLFVQFAYFVFPLTLISCCARPQARFRLASYRYHLDVVRPPPVWSPAVR